MTILFFILFLLIILQKGDSTVKKCEKNFPISFRDKTKITENGFLEHRRRSPVNGGEVADIFTKEGKVKHSIDNQWIATYNPFLLLKFDCHINVKKIESVLSVKYVFK